MTTWKMKFMRRTAGYTKWDQERNEKISDKLKIRPVICHIQNYQKKWKDHMKKTTTGRIPK